MRYRVMLLGLAVPALLIAQPFDLIGRAPALAQDRQQDQTPPRFRAGANLVRVDAYVSQDEVALTDLTVDDFTVFEDDQPQRVENFELVRARSAVPAHERREVTNTRDMRQQVEDAARVFTLFFDPLYVSLSGSYYLQKPLIETFEKVIGPDDMIGAMTPGLSPSAITYSKRTTSIEQFITRNWTWGQRDRIRLTPEEEAIANCYDPDDKRQRGLAGEMIARMRERKTLDALEALVTHLDGLRPERKFVIIFTEGWPLYESSRSLTRAIDSPGPTPDPITIDPGTGKLRPQGSPDPSTGMAMGINACERLRIQLAQEDHQRDFLTLLQRANRANVSFYPVDARGLLVFDQPTNFDLLPTDDQALLRRRHDALRDMAAQTDGYAVLNTGHVAAGLEKIFRDVGSYYLMSYYSTNQKLDGRFRRIRVEVRRPGADVRARPGYLAPTEAEARAAGAAMTRAVASGPPPTVTRALDSLAPTRGNLPVRVQAIGGRNTIRAIIELDAATTRQPEWLSGGTLRLTFLPESTAGSSDAGLSHSMTVAVDPGQRSVLVNGSDRPLPPGRYSVRAELTPRNSRLPIQVTTLATVPADAAEVGSGALASRRGPSTGLAYVPTADPRFRRTERLRVDVPLAAEGFTGTGRLLTRNGTATALVVTFSSRADAATKQQFGVADVALAPLAEGEYVLELTLAKNGASEVVSYGFRIVP
jgi:VWFA-related protein